MYRRVSDLIRTPIVLLLLLLSGVQLARAQTASSRGSIEGTVVDSASGAPRLGVAIILDGTGRGAMSDGSGRFAIPEIPVGTHILRTRQISTRPLELSVEVRSGVVTNVVLRVASAPVTLGAVTARARPIERDRFELSPSVGTISITPSSVKHVPSFGEPDILRTVQLMPGVNARNDFSSGYNVRGGESDQNLILLDGYPIYNPFHLGGLFSTFLDETVGAIDLFTGGFGAAHGGRISSILDVSSANESRQGIHGTASVSVISSSLSLGTASSDGRSNLTVSGRRTYADKLISAISDQTFPYHFSDAQFHGVKAIGDGNLRLEVTGYAGSDVLDADISLFADSAANGGSAGAFIFGWANQLIGTTLRDSWHDRARLPLLGAADSVEADQRFSLTRFATSLDIGAGSFVLSNSVHEFRATGGLKWHRGQRERSFGYDASTYAVHYSVNTTASDVELYSLVQHPSAGALYYQERWKPTKRLITEAGVRLEHLSSRNWAGISPRAALKFFVTPDFALSAAVGNYAQWMHSLNREDVPVRIFDFWVASDEYVNVSQAQHYVLGMEQWLGPLRFARLEAWGKRYDHVLEQNTADDPARRGDEFLDAGGTSYGFDVLVRQLEVGTFGGWLSYTYGVSTRQRANVSYWPGHDRRHNVNVVGTWKPGSRYVFSARLGVASGTPYTNIVGQIARRAYNPLTHSFDDVRNFDVNPIGGDHNGSRYPLTQRLDLGVSRAMQWRTMSITPYLSVVNAYNAHNVFIYTFDYTANPPTRETASQFPFLPSIGMTIAF